MQIMPELPEVETVKRGLNKLIIGRKIVAVNSDNPKSFPNAPDDVEQFLIDAKVTTVRRRAKVLMIDLSTNYTLVIHLKMTGQLVFVGQHIYENDGPSISASSRRLHAGSTKGPGALLNSGSRCLDETEMLLSSYQSDLDIVSSVILEPESELAPGPNSDPERSSDAKNSIHNDDQDNDIRFAGGHPTDSLIGVLPDKSTRVIFDFDDGSHLYFNDQRKFGWVRLMPTAEVPNIDFMKRVGPEPLESDFTAKQFVQRFKRRARTTIKAAILDQSVIAGVGNIYADESLWGAKIHPATKVGDLPYSKFQLLYSELRYVMNLSIEKGGSTNRNYVNAEGKKGRYMEFARVFRREGLDCPRCGDEIVKIRVAGRGTHICPSCQVL
jgi:formamidopyrimidine-DNA glycosylase